MERSLSSYARCYRVESIDRLGRISEASDISCNDNCPFIEFPNVFTPNSDGCNDQFGPYGRNVAGEESDCQMLALQKCPRFVNGVKFSVYNRLGQKVYGFESSDDESKYISWDGRDTKGNELPSAIYYYSAEVSFLTALKGNRNKFMKGWVHLLR